MREMQFFSFLSLHLALGIGIGWAVLAGILWLDVARLSTLLFASPHATEGMVMLSVVFAVTFGGAVMGSAIMALGQDDEDGAGGKGQRVRLARRSDGRVVQIKAD